MVYCPPLRLCEVLRALGQILLLIILQVNSKNKKDTDHWMVTIKCAHFPSARKLCGSATISSVFRISVVHVTSMKQLADLLAAQVIVHIYFKTQFAEGSVEFLRISFGSIPFPQGYSIVKGGHRHHHSPVALPHPLHGCSSLLQVRSESLTVSVLYVSLFKFNSASLIWF